MKIVMLGTSSATPTAERNPSATAVIWEGEILLFDCGEGTQIQMRKAGLRIGRLTKIFITHLHGDHVLGLPGLLSTYEISGRIAPLHLYGPAEVQEYVETSQKLLRLTLSYPLLFHEVGPGLVCEEQRYYVEALPLRHVGRTFGYALQEKDRPGRFNVEAALQLGVPAGPLFGQLQRGFPVVTPAGNTVYPEQVLGPTRPGRRIAYCLDTRPCPEAEKLAQGADLLIYDSTYGPGDEAKAAERGHSTAQEAVEVALRAGAKRLILTHIGSQYNVRGKALSMLRRRFPAVEVAADLASWEIPPKEPEVEAKRS
ncbi:MAG: ribonuclease Z [Nitrospinota bacterium]|nr:MAG: ribonuclease Z [Nitrospinota bacterium]